MDRLYRIVQEIRTQRPPLSTTSALALLSLGIWWCVRDYRAFLALGPGGVPYNVFGWAVITVMVRPLALSAAAATRTDDYEQAGAAHPDIAALPAREGPRPRVGGIAPHRQLDQHAPKALGQDIRKLFADAAARNPTLLEMKLSGYEQHNDALFVCAKRLAEARGLPPAAVAARGEIGHPHPDLSIHLYVAPADARVLIEQGWAERHRMSVPNGWRVSRSLPVFRRIGDSFLMVYGPRNDAELSVLRTILRQSICFMATQEDFDLPELGAD